MEISCNVFCGVGDGRFFAFLAGDLDGEEPVVDRGWCLPKEVVAGLVEEAEGNAVDVGTRVGIEAADLAARLFGDERMFAVEDVVLCLSEGIVQAPECADEGGDPSFGVEALGVGVGLVVIGLLGGAPGGARSPL